MRRTLIALAITLSAASAYAHGSRTWHSEDFEENCRRRQFNFNNNRAYTEIETIDAGALRSLKIDVTSSPVSVVGGTGRGYTIQVCKAAEVASDLKVIRVSVDGNELRADGPSNNDWTVAYRIEAPRGADITVDAKNGPIAFGNVEGKVVANLRNGPLALSDVRGDFDVTTANGPVSISGGSGTIKVAATNGPLSVELEGNSFNGTLEARTKNGPLSVTVPEGYNSGVVVEMKGGPLSCRAEACRQLRARGDWDIDEMHRNEPRTIELGNGPTNVRISTVNGPVTIREK